MHMLKKQFQPVLVVHPQTVSSMQHHEASAAGPAGTSVLRCGPALLQPKKAQPGMVGSPCVLSEKTEAHALPACRLATGSGRSKGEPPLSQESPLVHGT